MQELISELCPIEQASVPPAHTIQPLRSWYRSDEVHDLALPGDEDTIIRYKTQRAIERDNRFNAAEFTVFKCMVIRHAYHSPVCLAHECDWCGGLREGDIRYFKGVDNW